MKKARAVVDTNLFVSGIILKRDVPYLLLESWHHGLFILVTSQLLRAELEEVLKRPEICQKYQIHPEETSLLINLFDQKAEKVTPIKKLPVQIRDPKDEVVLATALGGRADYLVTGDNDLLVLNNHPKLGKLLILTAREFLDQLTTL